MRYEDWDVILFPVGRDCKTPFKEFKVACHVVHDIEFSHIHGATFMPNMTCFVPSLPAGIFFQMSVHNWSIPNISEIAQSYSEHTDDLKFEVRVLIDGCLAVYVARDIDVYLLADPR
jgi:hypothetical protein